MVTREGTAKDLAVQNHWVFVLATEPAMTPEAVAKVRYSGKKLVEDVKEALRGQ